MTLASAGRTQPRLWDVATGELLLGLDAENTMTSIVYSPKGDSLAVGAVPAWGSLGRVSVYEINEKRGQQVMRGLRSRITQVRISANNRFVAAISDNWQLGLWDVQNHRLLHVFQVPIGVYAESAGLAIDSEERRIAMVAGSEARICDIHSGELLNSVPMQPGFLDCVVFQDANTLISARQESVDPKFLPYGPNFDPDITPRVCRIRNLLGAEPQKPFLTISEFKRSAASVTITPSGKRLLIEGYFEAGEVPEHRLIKLFDLPSGTPLWEIPSNAHGAKAHRIHAIDPLGRVIAMSEESMTGKEILIDLESKNPIRDVKGFKALGPNASMNILAVSAPELPGKALVSLVQGEKDKEVLRLGVINPLSDGVTISTDERYVVYGCADGSVVVADLSSVKQKLAEVGLY